MAIRRQAHYLDADLESGSCRCVRPCLNCDVPACEKKPKRFRGTDRLLNQSPISLFRGSQEQLQAYVDRTSRARQDLLQRCHWRTLRRIRPLSQSGNPPPLTVHAIRLLRYCILAATPAPGYQSDAGYGALEYSNEPEFPLQGDMT